MSTLNPLKIDIVSDVVFTFRTAMDTTSFSLPSGIVSFTGPNGAITAMTATFRIRPLI